MSRRRRWRAPSNAFVGHPAVSRNERRALARSGRKARKQRAREGAEFNRLPWRQRFMLALCSVLASWLLRMSDIIVALYAAQEMQRRTYANAERG